MILQIPSEVVGDADHHVFGGELYRADIVGGQERASKLIQSFATFQLGRGISVVWQIRMNSCLSGLSMRWERSVRPLGGSLQKTIPEVGNVLEQPAIPSENRLDRWAYFPVINNCGSHSPVKWSLLSVVLFINGVGNLHHHVLAVLINCVGTATGSGRALRPLRMAPSSLIRSSKCGGVQFTESSEKGLEAGARESGTAACHNDMQTNVTAIGQQLNEIQ